MDAILWEWLSFFVRWTHVIAAVAWIGSSFYFVHLDQSLKPNTSLPEGAHGDEWQVHGGGFYHMVKYLVAPPALPEHVTWFKWEAYATWLSGFALLAIVYYCGAELFMIDRGVLDIPPATAVAASVAGLAVGWIVYDALCRSTLNRSDLKLALAVFVMVVGFAVLYGHVYSGRGAFMQVGSIMGTIMAANVFMIIIPNQRIVVADLKAGRAPDPKYGATGKQRSLHNNYFTLPVVFIMIANHYPLAYATRFSWAIIALVIVMGVSIRHFYNTSHRGLPPPWWTWGVTASAGLFIVFLSSFASVAAPEETQAAAPSPLAEAAEIVVQSRCAICHATEPLWPGMGHAPKGVKLETLAQMERHSGEIRAFAVLSRAMPPGNITKMTEEDRDTLARWLDEKR